MIANSKVNKTMENLLKKSDKRYFSIASACAVKTPGVFK